ncbi:uncharacterized protein isoform X2 [Choristoneura fumiferana]
MARIAACALLLALTASVRSQFFADLFQYQPFITSSPLRQIYDDTSRRIKTDQNRYNNRGAAKYEQTVKNDDRKDNGVIPISSIERDEPIETRKRKTTAASYNTTVKPRKVYSGRRVVSSNRRDQSTQIDNSNNDNGKYDGKVNYFNDYYTQKPNYDSNYDDNNESNRRSDYDRNNYYTTNNPLKRPGVRPAVVDSRPPITNRPVTRKPSYGNNPSPRDEDAIAFPGGGDSPQVTMGPDEEFMSQVEKKRYIELAERMCDKYKALTTTAVQAIPLLPSPEPVRVNVSECTPVNVPLVVGGRVVKINEFPHMTLLGWRKLESAGYSWKCGGSLVSEQFVLTAAHCSYQDRDNTVVDGPPRAVQLGSSYLDDPGALVVRVASVIRHPKYKQPRSYYDLALVKLVNVVKFSEVIKPACLGVAPSAGQSIIATGWGRTEYGGDQSHELRSVSIPIWRMDKCREVLGTSRKLPDGPSSESQVCAGEERGGKDTCQGDSGGPAQLQDGCVWRVVAVTSLGRSCGAAETPGLYAIAHRAFIASQIFGSQKDSGNYDTNNKRPGASSVNYDTNNRQPGTSSVNYDANNRRPGTSSVNYDTNNRQPGTGSGNYDTNNRQPGTSSVNYDANNRRPGTSSVNYDTNNRQPGTGSGNYDTNNRQPGTSSVNYDTNNRQPGASNINYDSNDNNRQPGASNVNYDTNNRRPGTGIVNYRPDSQVTTQRPHRSTVNYYGTDRQKYNTQRPNSESNNYSTQRPSGNDNDGIIFNYDSDYNNRNMYTTRKPSQDNVNRGNNDYENSNRGQTNYDSSNNYGSNNDSYSNNQGAQNNYNRRPSSENYTINRPWWSK